MEALFERFRRFQEEVFPAREDISARSALHAPKQPMPSRIATRGDQSNSHPPLLPFNFKTAVQKKLTGGFPEAGINLWVSNVTKSPEP